MNKYFELVIRSKFGIKYDPFNLNPENPDKWDTHTGIDFRPKNDEVYSMFNGVVGWSGFQKRAGVFCQIHFKHKNVLFKNNYFHNDSLKVKDGDIVKENDIIAVAGNTGKSTAKHIHLEVYVDIKDITRVKDIMKNVKHYIHDEWKRIYFDPFGLYNYLKDFKQ